MQLIAYPQIHEAKIGHIKGQIEKCANSGGDINRSLSIRSRTARKKSEWYKMYFF